MCTKKEAMEEITRNLENRQDADTRTKEISLWGK